MAFKPGQSGNPSGRRKEKPWADAIKRALARREHTGSGADLNRLAETLLDKGAEGDMAALKGLGDRLDGKVPQGIVGDADFDPVRLVVTPVDASL